MARGLTVLCHGLGRGPEAWLDSGALTDDLSIVSSVSSFLVTSRGIRPV